MESFANKLKRDQTAWALENGLKESWLEMRNGQLSHVLKKEFKNYNFYKPKWQEYIAGKEHTYARALNSSQAFAVNLYGPIADDSTLAKIVLLELMPERPLVDSDKINVYFEYTPNEATKLLGEKSNQQGTQVDVALLVNGAAKGFVLIEVKLSEPDFGGCRGPKELKSDGTGNSNPERCRNFGDIYESPETSCWLVDAEGRRYWEHMKSAMSSFSFVDIPETGPCPFQHGLYQLMRNRVLADALVRETDAQWADFAVCIHPGNDKARILPEPVAGHDDVIEAMRVLAGQSAVQELSPVDVVNAAERADNAWRDWAVWMRDRYF